MAIIPKQLKVALALGTIVLLTACQTQGTSPVIDLHSSPSTQKNVENVSGQAVAYQINTEHTGFAEGPLLRPLKQLWSVKLPVERLSVGYPVIANGIVVVTANQKLIALDEKTGKRIWVQNTAREDRKWVGQAYDNGMIFASSSEVIGKHSFGTYAFDERTGKKLWSGKTPGQVFISSAPTAAFGTVYTAAVESGGTLYAYDESTGVLKWSASVAYGDNSSPVVTSTGVFVSYVCPQTYDFNPSNGALIWHYSGPCAGGGGSTPVLYDGLLFVGDSDVSTAYNGLILNAKTGKPTGAFNAVQTPAFADNLGFFVGYKTLEEKRIPTMKHVWTVTLPSSDSYESAAVIVGNIVYLSTFSGNLVGYDIANGKQKVLMKLSEKGFDSHAGASLAFGDGELIVPNGSHLVAFGGS